MDRCKKTTKIGICTHCAWTSYGSVLQSWALKQVLLKLGVSSVIISDEKDTFINNEFRIKSIRLLSLLRFIYCVTKRTRINSKFKKMVEFKDGMLDVLFYDSVNDLKNNLPDVDFYIAGSDQIFHPDTCNPVFFLSFVPSNVRKASYAASMGVLSVKGSNEKEFKRLINNFDFLSVREQDCADLISKYTDKNVLVHVDPTLLLDVSEWRKLSKPYPINDKYILLYAIYWDPSFNKKLRELEKHTGFRIVSINSGLSKTYSSKRIFDSGVEEFLWLIDHAEAVITSSFHGAVLSVIFKKKLSVIVNPLAPSRISSFLKVLQLETPSIENVFSEPVDYSKVDEHICRERERSIDYLKRVLFDE